MEFLLPLYSSTSRPAKNQPQILRYFILFLLLYSDGLAKPSLTLWVDGLKDNRVLAALIGCTPDSLPPLGSYFDFMNRLWAAPATDLYTRGKLLPASWNRKKPDKPKGKSQKAQEGKPKITESIEKRLMDGKDIPFNFEQRLQHFFYHVAVLPPMACGLMPGGAPPCPATALPYIPMPPQTTTTETAHRTTCAISPTPMRPGARTAAWINTILDTLCSSYPVITGNSGLTSPCSCALPAQGAMILSASLPLSMNLENISWQFPPRTCAWTPQWTITLPTGSPGTGERQMRPPKNGS